MLCNQEPWAVAGSHRCQQGLCSRSREAGTGGSAPSAQVGSAAPSTTSPSHAPPQAQVPWVPWVLWGLPPGLGSSDRQATASMARPRLRQGGFPRSLSNSHTQERTNELSASFSLPT